MWSGVLRWFDTLGNRENLLFKLWPQCFKQLAYSIIRDWILRELIERINNFEYTSPIYLLCLKLSKRSRNVTEL
ncbi:hypothetical protein ASC94_13320 [Massilia sp. Root418]|nr:hypothetical protein ASC94_13320 [Massilia sp. Root418]